MILAKDIIDQMKLCPPPESKAGFLLWQVANKFEKRVNEELKEFGFNQSEYFHLISLVRLAQKGQEVTQADIAKFADTIPMNTSKIMTKFEKKGLIKRVTGTDSRSKSIQITQNGLSVAVQIASKIGQLDSAFF